ncbi:MAG TPA: transglutaminase-like domain-containing protein [Thermoanaerobaculia bacterium]|nr:transglutaminase-like domain-containing protein [Thermoanaerobaculia bacterium]
MDRRRFLMTAGVASATLALPKASRLFALGLTPVPWRTFEVTTRVEVLKPAGATRVWLPAALLRETPYQKTLANEFRADGGKAELVEAKDDSLGIVSAAFPEGVPPVLTLTCRVSTRNWTVDLSRPGTAPKPNPTELEYYLKATKVVPTDGIVKEKALEITEGKTTDVAKARCLYDWIVDNTYRNPKTRGCGLGDVKFLLESGDLGGKCADLNALYVALARAAGIPARHVYGLRIVKSELGYKSLGPATEVVTKGQHCRDEVWLKDYGWVPVDPADVRKVVLEEPPGNLPLEDPVVKAARERLFGSWEMNWMALNFGHDVALPGSRGAPINYFMYPQGETADGRLDPFDPDAFKYQITAKELPAAS